MTINFPGPYGLRFFYTVSGLEHKQEFNIDCQVDPTPGDAFSTIQVDLPRTSSPDILSDLSDDWATFWSAQYNNAGPSLTRAELWRYTPGTFNAAFISTYDINQAGAASDATVPSSEQIYTFRTQEGGTMRIHFEETTLAPGPSQTYTQMLAGRQALVDYILSDACAFLGRDTSIPFAFLKLHPGQSEKIFKIRNR